MKAEARCRCFTFTALLGFLTLFNPSFAQQMQQPPTLDEILQRLQENLDHYNATIPSFICDEHSAGTEVPGSTHQNETMDSTFRFKRVVTRDHKVMLEESRHFTARDGHPVRSSMFDQRHEYLAGIILREGLSLVSLGQKACMRYTLQPIKPDLPRDPYIVKFSSLPASERSSDCLLQEDGSGWVSIDPVTMQIKCMELSAASDHYVYVGGGNAPNGDSILHLGVWGLAVDYSPVLLGGQSFWLPANISWVTQFARNGPSKSLWSFTATYSNYHVFEATARILPSDGQTVPQPSQDGPK